MPLLEVDEDVYQYLLRNAVRIGEEGSSILRRLLKLEEPATNGGRPTSIDNGVPSKELAVFLTSSLFLASRDATQRYLLILSFLCTKNPGDFEKVLGLGGRTRVYFGRTREEIERSGETTHPRKIPHTSFWAMTNASTADKKKYVRRVLRLLGYPKGIAGETARAIEFKGAER